MVMSWPSTVMAVVLLALVGVGTLVVLAAQEVVLGVLGAGTRREGVGVERALDAPGDLLGGDGLAVLPLRVVADREGPLREVVVGRAQVGREVGDQHRLALLVTHVLRERAVGQRLLDRVAGDGPAVGRVERVGAGVAGQVDRDGPTSGGALDLGGGALTLGVLAAALLRTELSVSARTGGAAVVAPAATGSKGEEGNAGHERERLVPLHAVQPFLSVFVPAAGAVGSVLRRRPGGQRRVLGSRASRIASPRRLSESTSSTTPIRGSHR